MKKIVLLVVVGLVFGILNTSAQNNYVYTKHLGTKINIPNNFNEFKVAKNRDLRYFDIPKLLSVNEEFLFIDNNFSINYKKKEYLIINLNKFINISSYKTYDDCGSFEEFEFYNTDCYIDTMSIYIVKEKENNNIKFNCINMLDDSIKYNKTYNVTKILFRKDYYKVLNLSFEKSINKTQKWLVVFRTIKVKNECLCVNLACIYDGQKSINWIIDTSEELSKAILEANK